jgi:hypothetical protein
MALFESSKDLFELISRPQASPSSGAYQTLDQLFSCEGKTVVIVDEWTEKKVAGVKETLEVTLRKDTLIVVVVVASVLVCLAFLAGRATVRDKTSKTDPTGKKATAQPLPKEVFDPGQAAQPRAQPRGNQGAVQPVAPAPAPAPTQRRPVVGKYECQVVTTRSSKAQAVVKYLNESSTSPIAARHDLQAYVRGRGVVRIRGFTKRDKGILGSVQKMKDPTGGGHFNQALFLRTGPR